MHCSSHPPRAFRNRIARNLGVLVAAALVAALGLPSAAQAQTPAAPTVTGTGDGTSDTPGMIKAEWGAPLGGTSMQDGWLLEYTAPGVAWDDAEMKEVRSELSMNDEIDANDPEHNGVWRFRVSYSDNKVVIGDASALTDYLHGPPAAPTGFTAHNAGPDARRLVWDAVTGTSYDTRYTPAATDDDEWTDWKMMSTSGMLVEDLDMGVDYTFEVRALGMSRAGVGDLHGPSASHTEVMPMPTPTLPEIALLLLAMLLLGGGAYLLRGRQSGGLTHA